MTARLIVHDVVELRGRGAGVACNVAPFEGVLKIGMLTGSSIVFLDL
jgi:hypothetical protein